MAPFAPLVPLLVKAIPLAVSSLRPKKPLAIVRVYFYDTHAPCTYLLLRTVSAECRADVLATRGAEGPFYLWGSGEDAGDGEVIIPPEEPSTPADQKIASLFEQIYELLGEDEEENMPVFREMLREVCRTLNVLDWTRICPVTDDFVVVPADGSMFFGGDDGEDILECVPAERVALLRSRRFLGSEESWEKLT